MAASISLICSGVGCGILWNVDWELDTTGALESELELPKSINVPTAADSVLLLAGSGERVCVPFPFLVLRSIDSSASIPLNTGTAGSLDEAPVATLSSGAPPSLPPCLEATRDPLDDEPSGPREIGGRSSLVRSGASSLDETAAAMVPEELEVAEEGWERLEFSIVKGGGGLGGRLLAFVLVEVALVFVAVVVVLVVVVDWAPPPSLAPPPSAPPPPPPLALVSVSPSSPSPSGLICPSISSLSW